MVKTILLAQSLQIGIAIATTLLPLTLTALNGYAATKQSQTAQGSSQHQLIAKQAKSANVNTQQADVEAIHQTLTQFYRGVNELDLDRMTRATLIVPAAEKAYTRRMFDRLKASRVDFSVEVRNIELVSISPHNALVKVEQLVKSRSSSGASEIQGTSSIALIKTKGKWKISDNDTVMKSMRHN